MAEQKRSPSIRLLEILPGALTWATLIAAPLFSYTHPVWVSIFIIAFDLYWFLKGGNVALHLIHSYRKLKNHNRIDWREWCEMVSDRERFITYLNLGHDQAPNAGMKQLYLEHIDRLQALGESRNLDWRRIYHLIIVPIYKESLEVLSPAIESYAGSDYPGDRLILVLALEERAGEEPIDRARILEERFKDRFHKIYTVVHPDGLPNETIGKGSNCSYAAEMVTPKLQDLGIPFEDILVSNFDCDTTVARNYFAHLTFDFLTIDKPLQASYQPMPMFHNNIWDTPAIARVIAVSSSFWQLVEASRPDRLVTFSSHSMSFKTLVDVGYWRRDLIPEDSYIFWQCFNHFNGDYRTFPLFTIVSMDAVLGSSYVGTLIAQYKQKRRWAWGAIQISLVFPQLRRNRKMPAWKKLLWGYRMVEGYYFWATASIMIPILGWLPLYLGGAHFGTTIVAVNLPIMTRWIMTTATFFLLFSVYISFVLLPPRPKHKSFWMSLSMLAQWVFSPIVSSVFGSLPAIDAQTRLMFGRYMEFWVTPKIRKSNHAKEIEQGAPVK